MRKPYRQRAEERENVKWEDMTKKLKSDRQRACCMLFVSLALFLGMSWHRWDGSVFSFSPPAYFLLALILFPVGMLVLSIVMGSAVFDVFREVRAMKREIRDFKARRCTGGGQ
jgi:hypothetical protein